MACLCCDTKVLLNLEEVSKLSEPVAMCKLCFLMFQMSWSFRRMTRVVYLMRSQIKTLFDWRDDVDRSLKKIFSGMEDFEEALKEGA